ncbi:hypothetical protein KY316_00900 [Candidatus Woesearchaeota archaeon]|nr:hypothetical protein [Candidatus Woesearchaeota archaeon]
MHIKIFGKAYSEHEWKKALASNEGIFSRIKLQPQYLGPQLTETFEITGDFMGLENSIFEKYATPFQHKAFDELEKQSREKANEYLLTICGAIDKWRQDVRVLQDFLTALREEEHELKEEEKTVHRAEVILHFPEVLKRRLPELFAKLEAGLKNMDTFLNEVRAAEKQIEYIEKKIEAYLESLRTKMHFGFLFAP